MVCPLLGTIFLTVLGRETEDGTHRGWREVRERDHLYKKLGNLFVRISCVYFKSVREVGLERCSYKELDCEWAPGSPGQHSS